MFDRLGHVTYRRRRLVLALAGGLPGLRRGSGAPGSSARWSPAASTPRAASRPGRWPAPRPRWAGAAPTSSCSTATAGRTVDDPAFRAAVEEHLADAADRPGGLDHDVPGRAGPAADRFVSEDRAVDLRRPAARRRPDDDALMEAYEDLEPTLRDAPAGLDVRLGGDEAIASDITTQVSEDIARAEPLSLPIVLVLLVRHLRRADRGEPAAGDRRTGDPRCVHHAAAAQPGHRRLDLLDQHRDDARPRPGDRLRAVRRQPVPRGGQRRARTPRRPWYARWRPPAAPWRSPV